ncbi:polynucleotide adenylyltransferase [Planctomycetota bacterium]
MFTNITFKDERLPQTALRICQIVAREGGCALVVGGTVRDAMLGFEAKDLDMEVYFLHPQKLERLIKEHFEVDLVGQSFGVLKIKHLDIDIAVPRRESKQGLGHKGFMVKSDPEMSIEDAASRRDFTINAMLYDFLTGELIDPYDGMTDLKNGLLRHTSEKFIEDPLRVLRAMQFAARFELDVEPETIELCRSIEPEGLPAERIFEEWKKLILKGRRPSLGLAFLKDCGWIRYFPELEALIGCDQEAQWHPEGDVWTHTLHVMDSFALNRVGDPWEDLVVGLACLCHDLGKPETTKVLDGQITADCHEMAGVAKANTFLQRMTNQKDIYEQALPLVQEHMKPGSLYRSNASRSAIRRLAIRAGRIDRLIRVSEADYYGRNANRGVEFAAGKWLSNQAKTLSVLADKPKPIILGRHLVELGLKPGAHFKSILDKCYQAQLDEVFTDLESGLQYLSTTQC